MTNDSGIIYWSNGDVTITKSYIYVILSKNRQSSAYSKTEFLLKGICVIIAIAVDRFVTYVIPSYLS